MVSWIEWVYTGSNPAVALTRPGCESAARRKALGDAVWIGKVGGSSEAPGFMGVSCIPKDHGSSSLKRYLGLLDFILVPIVGRSRVNAGPASQRDVRDQSHLSPNSAWASH